MAAREWFNVSASTANGTNVLVAARTGKRIALKTLFVSAGAACNVSILDGSGGTALLGPLYCATSGDGMGPTELPGGICQPTTPSTGLYANLTTTGPVTIEGSFEEL